MNSGINLFNRSISDSLIKNKRYLLSHPSYLVSFSKIIRNIKKQNEVRDSLCFKENLIVPPILILSITNECNLSCAGCYACAQKRDASLELKGSDFERVIREAIDLGVSIILIAGGEPLLKKWVMDVAKKHSETLFIMFTNGVLINDGVMHKIKHTKNLIPVVSIEGDKQTTDRRRGEGMYENIMDTMKSLKKIDIMFGSSITLTSKNYDTIIGSGYLDGLEKAGCAAAFLIEYVPQSPGDPLTLTETQKQDLLKKTPELIKKHNMLIVALPGNEEKYNGCLAAGRGFLHISSEGFLEACPFAPFSDTNIKNISLKEALKSKLMEDIRQNHDQLKESKGGCALNENREWVEKLMKS